jgi:hypothetical protein
MLEDRTGVWLGSAPDPLLDRIHEDCNKHFYLINIFLFPAKNITNGIQISQDFL